jgi:hypothetical protein
MDGFGVSAAAVGLNVMKPNINEALNVGQCSGYAQQDNNNQSHCIILVVQIALSNKDQSNRM